MESNTLLVPTLRSSRLFTRASCPGVSGLLIEFVCHRHVLAAGHISPTHRCSAKCTEGSLWASEVLRWKDRGTGLGSRALIPVPGSKTKRGLYRSTVTLGRTNRPRMIETPRLPIRSLLHFTFGRMGCHNMPRIPHRFSGPCSSTR